MRNFKKATNKHLGELLVERGVINHEQLNISIEHQKKHPDHLLGELLVELKFATEKDIAQALTCQYGFPYLPLSSYEIDAEVVRSVPEKICKQFCLVPIDKIGKSLTIAMSNPLNLRALEDVELITGCSVQVFVSTSSDIKQSIEKYYKTS